jgi:hypothetical protein
VTPGVFVASGGVVGAVEGASGLAAAGFSVGGAAGLGLDLGDSDGEAVVAAVSVPVPVLAPVHQSFEARCFGEAFR